MAESLSGYSRPFTTRRAGGRELASRSRALSLLLAVLAIVALAWPGTALASEVPPCSWPLETTGSGLTNVAYPDTNATYWSMPFDSSRWKAIVIHGIFPEARFMSFTTYDASGSVADSILDFEITADPQSRNPFTPGQAGAGRGQGRTFGQAYTVTISRDRQAAKGGNYLDMAGTTLGWVIYRIYVPDQGKDRQGGVPLPSVTLIAQDGTPHPLQPCAFPDFATAAQSVLAYLRANGFDDAADLLERKLAEGDDGGVGTGTTCAPDQVAFAIPQNTGGYFPNAANKYIAAPDLCFQPGRIVVVRGKAPVVPNTYYGDPVWRPPGQSAKLDMRYYSMCNNVQEKPFPVVLCKADWDTKLDSQGYYTYVMSEDESGTTPPTPPGWVSPAATWLPWGSIVFRNILLMRHMLPAASFGQSVQAAIEAGCTFDNESGVPVSYDDIAAAGQCAQEVMGPYYPVAVRCDKALYIAQGWQGCFAAAGVPAP